MSENEKVQGRECSDIEKLAQLDGAKVRIIANVINRIEVAIKLQKAVEGAY